MKKFSVSLLLFLSIFVFAQNEFTATPKRLLPEDIIVDLPGKNSHEIYKGIKDWIFKNYENPKYAIKSDIENEYLRFTGKWNIKSKGPFGSTTLGVNYVLSFDIKDEKLRYNIDEIYGDENFSYYNCFKGNGERRKTKEIASYLNDIEVYADDYMIEFIKIINKKDDW